MKQASLQRYPLTLGNSLVAFLAAALLSSCADGGLFVTSTSVGIDLDMKVPTASIGYGRVEQFAGPNFESDGVPDVVAAIDSKGEFFKFKTRQVYATGEAAKAATQYDGASVPAPMYGETREVMYFGTRTTLGVRVSLNNALGGLPDEVALGFKRQEVSYIPIIGEGSKADPKQYGSVLAFIGANEGVESTSSVPAAPAAGNSVPKGSLGVHQFFATGVPAFQLSKGEVIRNFFESAAEEAATGDIVEQYKRNLSAMPVQGRRIAACYDRVPFSRIPMIWDGAVAGGIFEWGPEERDQWLEAYGLATSANDNDASRRNGLYWSNDSAGRPKEGPSAKYISYFMQVPAEADETKIRNRIEHERYVCDQAKTGG